MSKPSVTSSSGAISVVVADQTALACQLLVSSLQRTSSFNVVGYATTPAEALDLLKSHPLDVAVVSVKLRNGPLSGFNLLREIHYLQPETRVILLLDSPDRELVVDAFRIGARAVFCRSQSFRMLCKCIIRVYEGQIWADTHHIQFVLEALTQITSLHATSANGNGRLSQREQEIVARVAEGLSNRQIAKQLRLSEHTVKNYLFRIFDKLGVSGRVELVLYALSRCQETTKLRAEDVTPAQTPRPLRKPCSRKPLAVSPNSVIAATGVRDV